MPTLILSYYGDLFVDTLELGKYYTVKTAIAPTSFTDPVGTLQDNVDAVVQAINDTTGPFALAGFSYGAWVLSKVYDEIRSGSLTSRAGDFLGATVGGNPARKVGTSFPGGPVIAGHGIANYNLSGTIGSNWWEFAVSGDAITSSVDDTAGTLAQSIFDWIYGTYSGTQAAMVAAAQAAFNTADPNFVANVTNASGIGTNWGMAHMSYAFTKPITGDNRTIPQIATDQLKTWAATSPATTTVITVDGAFGIQDMRSKLSGYVTSGKIVSPYVYNNWQLFPDGSGFDTLVDNLNAKIVSTSGNITLFGASFGAVMIGSWLKRYGPTSTVGPDRLNVVLIANSARRYGGVLKDTGVDLVPADTRYQVLDIKRQYDGWADWPDRSATPDLTNLSWTNILASLAGVGTQAGQNAVLGMQQVHPAYDSLHVTTDEFYQYQEGNITYRMYSTYPMPITLAKYPFDAFVPSYLSQHDAQLRPMIELKYDRVEPVPKLAPLGGIASLEDSERLWNIAMAKRAMKERLRLQPPRVRLWDGDGLLRGEVAGWRDVDFEVIENDTGAATLELSLDHYLAKWVMNFRGRQKRNVLITIDKQGYRWSGFMDTFKVTHAKGGDRYLTITFKHDYEQAKHIYVWANPFLRPEVQFPKLWVIFGPAKWCILVTLFVNLMRLETSLWTLPDDPMNINSWIPFSFNPATWRNIVKPFPFLADNSNLTIIFSRFKSFHDTVQKDLRDAQLTITCRRYIAGEDPHPFSDLQGELDIDFVEDLFSLIPLKHFVLVWDVVDKSGWGTETAFGGSLLTGLVRAVMNIASDGTTEGIDVFTGDPTFPGEYYTPGFVGTNPHAPHVVFQDSMYTGVTESEFTFYEATDTSFLTGGHSMPGVNEAISAGVNMAGDFVTSIINTLIADVGAIGVGGGFGGAVTASVPSIDIPPLGGIMDALAKILYEDTFMAFMEVPTLRAAPNGLTLPIAGMEDFGTSLGDFHYYEGWADGADRAFTLSALMAVRAKMWATRARTVHKITVADAAPYTFGEKGYGDFGIGDRIGSTFREYPIPFTIFMERVQKARYGWGKDGPRGWTFTIGYQEPLDPAFKALDEVKMVNQALSTFGIL